jgi:hypothetical protein
MTYPRFELGTFGLAAAVETTDAVILLQDEVMVLFEVS